jgi:hypothetical protein
MGAVLNLFYPWGLLLYAVAVIHFIRRRPNGYWIWIILVVPFGVLAYIVIEVIPDLGLLRTTFEGFPRRKRIRHLEALVLDNPAVGNLEELGDLYLDEKNFKRAREFFDKAIAMRSSSDDAFYRRGIAEIELGDHAAAVPDLEYVVSRDRKYGSYRAMGLLAHAYAQTGQSEKAEAWFEEVTQLSTLSETYWNYANFLASQQRTPEAREWAQRILQKKPTMPSYLRRRERPWFRKAKALLKRLPQKQ